MSLTRQTQTPIVIVAVATNGNGVVRVMREEDQAMIHPTTAGGDHG